MVKEHREDSVLKRGDEKRCSSKIVNSTAARPLDGPHIHFISLTQTHPHRHTQLCPEVPLSRPSGSNLSRNRMLSDRDGDRGRREQRGAESQGCKQLEFRKDSKVRMVQQKDASKEKTIKLFPLLFYLWYVRSGSQKLNNMTRESARHVTE